LPRGARETRRAARRGTARASARGETDRPWARTRRCSCPSAPSGRAATGGPRAPTVSRRSPRSPRESRIRSPRHRIGIARERGRTAIRRRMRGMRARRDASNPAMVAWIAGLCIALAAGSVHAAEPTPDPKDVSEITLTLDAVDRVRAPAAEPGLGYVSGRALAHQGELELF